MEHTAKATYLFSEGTFDWFEGPLSLTQAAMISTFSGHDDLQRLLSVPIAIDRMLCFLLEDDLNDLTVIPISEFGMKTDGKRYDSK